jgi:hypothetical protein
MTQQNHSHIPIPKVLAKRQQEIPNLYTNNDYYEQGKTETK